MNTYLDKVCGWANILKVDNYRTNISVKERSAKVKHKNQILKRDLKT